MVKDVERYFDNSKCKICGVIVQPHFQGNTKLPKEEHLAKKHHGCGGPLDFTQDLE